MRTKLKICGFTNLQDAAAAADAGVDWLGFNFYKESPRYISPIEAGKIIKALNGSVKSAAILVRPSKDETLQIIEESGVDILQIYEPLGFTDLSQFSLHSIICYRIDPQSLRQEYPILNADMILLDSYSKNVLGGSGKAFNRDLIPDTIPRDKLVLAGGITPENISAALNTVNPAVIDTASGAESAPGIKDIEKIKKMVKEARKYNENRK